MSYLSAISYPGDCKCSTCEYGSKEKPCIKPLTCRHSVCYPPCYQLTCDQIINKQALIQRKIWFRQRVHSSEYVMNLSSLTVTGNKNCKNKNNNLPKRKYNYLNWNQSSDRAIPSISTNFIPRIKTSNRPGGTSSAGKGVDIKHNSYARYLARKKSKNLATNTNLIEPPCQKYFNNKSEIRWNNCHLQPLAGNKWFEIGLVKNCNKLNCCKGKLKCTEKDCKN